MRKAFLGFVLFFSFGLKAQDKISLFPNKIQLYSKDQMVPKGRIVLPLCNFDLESEDCQNQWTDHSIKRLGDVPMLSAENYYSSSSSNTPKLKPEEIPEIKEPTPVLKPGPDDIKPTYFYSLLLDDNPDPDIQNLTAKDVLDDPKWEEVEVEATAFFPEGDETRKIYKRGNALAIVSNKDNKPKVQTGSLVLLHKDAVSKEGDVYKVTQDAISSPDALNVTVRPKLKEGCVELPKKKSPPPELLKTESLHCSTGECYRNSYSRTQQDLMDEIQKVLTTQVNTERLDRIENTVAHYYDSHFGIEHHVCDPNGKIDQFVNIFNDTCWDYPHEDRPAYKNFEEYFKEAACASYKKGILPEFTMAIMSKESRGDCRAKSTKGDNSWGLLQVNANAWECRLQHSPEGETLPIAQSKFGNEEYCLAHPQNNLYKYLEIAGHYFERINGKKPSSKTPFVLMSDEEQDLLRRMLVGYNAGISRATGSDRKLKNLTPIEDLFPKKETDEERIARLVQKQGYDNFKLALLSAYAGPGTNASIYTESIAGIGEKDSPVALTHLWAYSKYVKTFYHDKDFCKKVERGEKIDFDEVERKNINPYKNFNI